MDSSRASMADSVSVPVPPKPDGRLAATTAEFRKIDGAPHRSSSLCRSESCAAARPERCWAHWSPAFSTRTATRIPCVVRSRWAGSLTTWPAGYGQKRRGGPSPSHWWERSPARWHRTRYPRSQPEYHRAATEHPRSGVGGWGLFVLIAPSDRPPIRYCRTCITTSAAIHATSVISASHLSMSAMPETLRLSPSRRHRATDGTHRPPRGGRAVIHKPARSPHRPAEKRLNWILGGAPKEWAGAGPSVDHAEGPDKPRQPAAIPDPGKRITVD